MNEPQVRVHVVDGTFELFRCFHGAPRHQKNGREVGAARGVLVSILSLIRKAPATHLAVAFDPMIGRSSSPPAGAEAGALLRAQYFPAADALRALGVTVWPMVRYQADDALASAAARFAAHPRVAQVVLCTSDKDLAQCVRGDAVVLLDRNRRQTWNEAGILTRFGVAPSQIPDLFALTGDPSDGFPGVPGWGPKTAATLLRRYGRVEDIPPEAECWDLRVRRAPSLAAALADRRREVHLVKSLSRLRDDLPLTDSLDDLEWRGARRPDLEEACRSLDLPEVLDRVPRYREMP